MRVMSMWAKCLSADRLFLDPPGISETGSDLKNNERDYLGKKAYEGIISEDYLPYSSFSLVYN